MRKLPEVQEAKQLMNEAMEWSTFKWLWEKQKVRETADRANAALERLEKAVKAKWSKELKAAYKTVSKQGATGLEKEGETRPALLALEKVVESDRAAYRARMDAEDTFDLAEKQMSTSLAREGCKKAIHGWELHERAIRWAEAAAKEAHSDEQQASL
jgi:hypothetical protein